MRVLLISEDGKPINAPVYATLAAQGVTFRHIVMAELRQERGTRLVRKLRRYIPGKNLTQPIASAVSEFQPDLVHAGSGRSLGLAVLKALKPRPDLPVLFDHGAIGGLNVFSPFDWMTYFNRRIAKIVVPSHALVNNWLGSPLLGRCISPERCAVLHHPLDLPDAPSAEDRASLRAGFGFAPDEFVIGSVCTVRPIKNLPFIARAIRQLGGKAVFAVVGGGKPDELARLKQAGGDSLRLLGPIPDARSMMSAFDLYVTPTRQPGESFGLAPGEAMAQSVPVLAMNFGGVAEIFDHGVSGLALPADAAHWQQAIAELASDPVRRERMGAAARARIGSRFSTDAIAVECLALYRRTVSASKAGA